MCKETKTRKRDCFASLAMPYPQFSTVLVVWYNAYEQNRGVNMAKIDEIKELLNSLRVWLSLCVGLIVVIMGGLISRYDSQKFPIKPKR